MVQIEKMPQEFEDARAVLQKIEDAGFDAFFVGGSVRDTLLNKPIHDVDIASSAYPAEIKHIFKKTVDTGIEHGTVMVIHDGEGYEVTTFRTESGYQDFRRPDQVTFVRSLKEDLMRRDFTINAFALKEDRTVIDIFDGLSDLEHKIIRAVGDPHERFHEDALRMMRAVRFASQLDFKIEAKTLKAIEENNMLLGKISVERILVEFEKMMLGIKPNRGLEDMLTTKLNKYCPGFKDRSKELDQLTKYPLELLENPEQVWTMIAWSLKLTPQEVMPFLKQWKTSNDLIKNVSATLQVLSMDKNDQNERLALFNAGEANVVNAIRVAQILGMNREAWLDTYQNLQIKDTHEMAITGKELIQKGIIKPGPQMGQVLNRLKLMVINDELKNESLALLNAVNKLQKDD
ncbi:CCA tRNA nucleotidyltransferase [Pediococcus pentosaceus]|uniref:CCA tRNA nucleotidyltransferase n=1 Tax=Pediococcus pentosaceus TaxID=1255 RepID=UPI0018A198B5|nr:CCA tRNA nucleotidyltransferase [Pediococcus pentosaceus]MBF7137190.1 CCA tRNA nucleotidyltransferase [Pediococcus pentosaceus]